MVHKQFNDDLDRFPYNRNDGADIDEVLNVRWNLSVCWLYLIVDFGFLVVRGFQRCRQPMHLMMSHSKIATA